MSDFDKNNDNIEFIHLSEKPITDFTPREINEIRCIARELLEQKLFKGDQFRITLEAFYRWIAIKNCETDLHADMKDRARVCH